MASLRSFAEVGGDWHGCGHDSFDVVGIKPNRRIAQRKVAERSQRLLARAIEAEIIPRLMLAHRAPDPDPALGAGKTPRPSADDLAEFIRLLLANNTVVISAYVEVLRHQGITLEIIFLELMAPAARFLGALWQEDLCNFADVTIALSRMQKLLRELAPAFAIEIDPKPCARSALLVAAPGDQHTFGISMVQEFFRRTGWQVRGGPIGSTDELIDIVGSEPFDVVGLSVNNEVAADELASMIRTIRGAAVRGTVRIMVGGRFFLEHPECVTRVGADATAEDGRLAVLRLSSLLRTNALR